MRTEPKVRYRGVSPGPALALLPLVVLAAVTFLVNSRPSTQAAVPIPADVARLGLTTSPLTPDGLAVSSADAIAAAWEVAPHLKDHNPTVDTFLVRATDPHWVQENGFKDRNIWIIRFSGIHLLFPGVPPADGSQAKGRDAHIAYVLIDADSMEAIDIQYWE